MNQKILAKRYVNVFLTILFCFLCPLRGEAVIIDRVVAVINDEAIPLSDLQIKKSFLLAQSKDTSYINRVDDNIVLEGLIEETLQVQAAQKQGYNILEGQVEDTIKNICAGNNIPNTERLEEELKKQKMTVEDLRRQIKNSLLIKKIVNQQVKSKILIIDEDINTYYIRHKDDYEKQKEFHIAHITLLFPKKDSKESIEQKAKGILNEIRGGMEFGEAARRYSDSPNANESGDLGFMQKEELLAEFYKALVNMKTGEISEPIFTEDGIHILKLIEERVPSPKNNIELKEDIHMAIEEELFQKRYGEWLDKLKKQAYIEIMMK
ncbi:MAG: peptidylprolyl isomerase [bacterium]